jgi:hypothetical protein
LENVNIFYSHWEYFTHSWILFRPVGTFCAHLVRFSGFGTMHQEKSGNPARRNRLLMIFVESEGSASMLIGFSCSALHFHLLA